MRNLYINNGTLVENTRTRISIGSIGKFFFGPFYSIIMQLFPTKSVSFSFPYIYCSQHQLLFFPISLNFTAINFLNYSRRGHFCPALQPNSSARPCCPTSINGHTAYCPTQLLEFIILLIFHQMQIGFSL